MDQDSADPVAKRAQVRGGRQLAAAVLPPILIFVALLVIAGVMAIGMAGEEEGAGLWAKPWQGLAWCLVAIAAALHRPLGSSSPSLGLGAMVMAPLILLHGAASAAVVAAITLVAAEALHRVLVAAFGAGGEERPMAPVFERAVASGLAVILAAIVEKRLENWVTPIVYVVALGLFLMSFHALRHGRRLPLRALAPLLLDSLGWSIGAGFAFLAAQNSWETTIWLWPAFAALSVEAARHAILRGRADQRIGSYERLHEAHERILAESSGMGGIAEQILIECRNILPLQWFQFEIPSADGGPTSWAAGPDGRLVEGRPHPPQRPQMLPGIHRRVTWLVIERPLTLQTPEGEDEVLATLRLWCDPRRLDAGAEELLGTLLPQMAASVHRARLDREARLDPLTGVPVRRVLEASLQRAYRRACHDGTPMAVIMCDIDFFKRVNDTWGHDAGDEALKLVAAALETTRRESDLCCRYGGEEFTVLLERTDGTAALQSAERLRRAVEALEFVYEGEAIPLTMSLGVAAFPELTIKTVSELQLLADEALYEAKERGRNQSLLNVGKGAFLAFPGVPRQESSTTMQRPVL